MQACFTIDQVTPVNGISTSLLREQLEIWSEKELLWVLGAQASTPSLWEQVSRELSWHLCTFWAKGFLQGATRKEGFYLKCDQTTMTQNDIDNGRIICEVGAAPASPAEFVVFRITFQLQSPWLFGSSIKRLLTHVVPSTSLMR